MVAAYKVVIFRGLSDFFSPCIDFSDSSRLTKFCCNEISQRVGMRKRDKFDVTVTYNVLTYKSCSVLKHIFGILAAITDADHYGRLGVTRLASTDEVNVICHNSMGPLINVFSGPKTW